MSTESQNDSQDYSGQETPPANQGGIQAMAFTARSTQEALNVLNRLFDAVKPEALFSQPITHRDYTVITASETMVGMGLGYGGGGGSDSKGDGGGGSGGGGGGASAGRPVAAISIGPNGVHVEPIVDPTKIAIAMFTTLGAIFMTWRTMRKRKNR